MAFSNINLQHPNFCLTPQAGTFGTINTSDATTILRVKNFAGGLISDYTLSSNVHPDNEIVAVEYCGPLNLTGMIDDVTFITVERLPTGTSCIVKRWELDTAFSSLNLKQQDTYYTTGHFYYDIMAAGVEHYHREFDFAQPSGQSYLVINNTSRIQTGDVLFLGPSTDTDNVGATEKATVSHIVGDKVYLNDPTVYQYVDGDDITFFNNVYLISQEGYAGASEYGTILKHNIYSTSRLEYTVSGEYKRITGARWSTSVEAVAGINEGQLLFIRPYDSYLKWKSMFLNNVYDNDLNSFDVYDVVFDGFTVYKLMKNATTKDDTGGKTTESSTTYNYQQDTLTPYTHHVAIHMDQQYTIGPDSTRIYIQTRDQFGVSLRDVNINMYDDGSDPGAQFTPLNGQGITDSNGEVDFGYTPGGLYTGPTTISVRADKSSTFTGSQYCWNSILIDGKVSFARIFGGGTNGYGGGISQKPLDVPGEGRLRATTTGIGTETLTHVYSIFTTPGGNWYTGGNFSAVCWPWFDFDDRTDGPDEGCFWDCITYPPPPDEPGDPDPCGTSYNPRPHFITQVLEFTQVNVPPKYYLGIGDLTSESKPLLLPQPKWFLQYKNDVLCGGGDCSLEDGAPVRILAHTLEEAEHDLGLSQLNLSKHSHWVDGVHTYDLETYVNLDQFIFVQDAVPAFWSEKNPRETPIWVRMRPQAFSLDGTTLKFFVREVWSVDDAHYDTGYYDVVDLYGPPTGFNNPNDWEQGCEFNNPVCLEYFDAGGGSLGIEFYYKPPTRFHHNALVYVHIEIYDEAAEPNYIYTDYWFRVIPDYNAPYLESESPARDEDQVALDTNIYFEIKDDGEGVDIDTLEVYLNSRIIYHAGMAANPGTTIEEVSLHHYKVTIDLTDDLQYGKDYSVAVRVSDVSENTNTLRDSYKFYTRESEAPWFTDFDPALCRRGMPRFRDVSFIVLGGGEGVDAQTIRIQVHDQDVTDESTITPVIYRIS